MKMFLMMLECFSMILWSLMFLFYFGQSFVLGWNLEGYRNLDGGIWGAMEVSGYILLISVIPIMIASLFKLVCKYIPSYFIATISILLMGNGLMKDNLNEIKSVSEKSEYYWNNSNARELMLNATGLINNQHPCDYYKNVYINGNEDFDILNGIRFEDNKIKCSTWGKVGSEKWWVNFYENTILEDFRSKNINDPLIFEKVEKRKEDMKQYFSNK